MVLSIAHVLRSISIFTYLFNNYVKKHNTTLFYDYWFNNYIIDNFKLFLIALIN